MDAIKVYLSQLQQNLQTGQATEHTHRPALQHLIQSLLPSVRALNEPRQIDCGAPDYVLQRGEEPLGYIEAKDIGENLDKVQKSDQLNRYRESLNNLILTDYLEFRWFLEGEYQRDMTVRLAEVDHHGRLKRLPENFPALPTLLESFSEARAAVTLRSPDELAAKMAKIAHLLRDLIGRAYQQEDQYGRLHAQLESFRQVLLDHLVSNSPTPAVYLEIKDGSSIFPLYLYPEKETGLFANTSSHTSESKRQPNFSPRFIQDLETHLQLKFVEDGAGDLQTTIGPEDIFHYMYAVFHSSTYRQRYAEFLKIDFPRLPLTSDKDLFRELTAVGRELVSIHLMEADLQKDSGYPVPGDNKVEKVECKNERVYINKTQYFDKVKPEVWEFYIGGYQVCQKWLKDRKGRSLSYDDCEHYRYILAAIERTMTLMESIDQIIPGFPLP